MIMKKKVFFSISVVMFIVALGLYTHKAYAKMAPEPELCSKTGKGCIVKYSDGTSSYYDGKWN